MTIEQLVAQWNASAENAQQHPDFQTPQADLSEADSGVQVRTGVNAGGLIGGGGNDNWCTRSLVPTSGCW